MKTTKEQAAQIQRINSMITGLTQYHRTAICSNAFSYIDDKIYKCAKAVFQSKYSRNHKQYKVSNLAWLCKECDGYIHGDEIQLGLNNNKVKKIEKYKAKLI